MGPGIAAATLEKFNGENYHLWSGKAKMVLTLYDLWEITSGRETRPVAVEETASAEVKAEVKRQQILYDKRVHKALAIIGLFCLMTYLQVRTSQMP